MDSQPEIELSICISTFKRADFIAETLESILTQMEPTVELIIVDGASPDHTPDVVSKYLDRNPRFRYYREKENSGVDGDYDKVVGYARGRFCWLMTDDDLLQPQAISRVLKEIRVGKRDLIVVNAELRNTNLSQILDRKRLRIDADREFRKEDRETFFCLAASYLSFIGCVVIKREFWLNRDRTSYYGSYFIHVGVIFQNPPLENAFVIADPLIVIRHGNSMWTPRSFEIWSFCWQKLIWSFPDYSDASKQTICHREPWRRFRTLLYARAMGAYTPREYKAFLVARLRGVENLGAMIASQFPQALANFIVLSYFLLAKRAADLAVYDLLKTRSSSIASKLLARLTGVVV